MTEESRRRDYLEALGVDVWALRGGPPDAAVAPTDEAPSVADAAQQDVSGSEWPELRAAVTQCTLCPLHKTRTQTVFGVGSETANLLIVGEAPGADEDRQGEPFVGRAGKLLDEMLRAVDLDRNRVFIANTLKCRPPNNRDPAAPEAAACRAYLDRQIALLQPRLILAVGRIAAQLLLATDAPLGRLRGQKHHLSDGQIPVFVTYHPAYLLRSPSQKRKVWQDLCVAKKMLEELT